MPLNLLKNYNHLLDIGGLNELNRRESLKLIFNRDIANNSSFNLRGKKNNTYASRWCHKNGNLIYTSNN